MNIDTVKLNTLKLRAPYVVFLGDIQDKTLAKTGAGLVEWRKENVLGQIKLPGCKAHLDVPELTIEQAISAGAQSIIIGVAPIGGEINASWIPVLTQALEAGLDVVSGLHSDLGEIPQLAEAQRSNRHPNNGMIINVRKNKAQLPIGNGQKRTGKRLLTVGTDCAVGKKYTALAMTVALNKIGIDATFRATGQTGIMIAGEGLPVDTVVCDFVSGAAELISPNNNPDHWDVIEGQGSLFNPSYSAVSMGLLHGSQPDAIIVCHDATREEICTCPGYATPAIKDCIELNLLNARIVNPNVRCIGVSVNTSALCEKEREQYLKQLSQQTGLPCVDPILDGCDEFASQLADLDLLDQQSA